MPGSPRGRFRGIGRRIGRYGRREVRALRRWIARTDNLLYLVILFLIPVVLAGITWLANATEYLSFLVYPPLASGTYTLFADPDGRYASPRKFVGGMTTGALCGWISLELTARYWYAVPPEQFQVHAGATAVSIFLTGLSTRALNLEIPTAFSTALLVLVAGAEQFTFVVSIAVSSLLVAGAFDVWYDHFYEHRAQYLFQTVKGDDHVLVPVRNEADGETALLAAYLAAAHEAGKVVLYRTVDSESVSESSNRGSISASRRVVSDVPAPEGPSDDARDSSVDGLSPDSVDLLRRIEDQIESTWEIPCEVVVVRGDDDDPRKVVQTAREVGCDLIVASYDVDPGETVGRLSSYLVGLFRGDVDVVGFHSVEHQTHWSQILVMVERHGEQTNAMLDFAQRLAPQAENVSVCTCIDDERDQSAAESMLRELTSSFEAQFDTHVSFSAVEEYVATHSSHYDLVLLGSSSDRGRVSRIVSPPTIERLDEVNCDLAIVHRG